VHRHEGAAAGALLRVLATGAALLAHDATLQWKKSGARKTENGKQTN